MYQNRKLNMAMNSQLPDNDSTLHIKKITDPCRIFRVKTLKNCTLITTSPNRTSGGKVICGLNVGGVITVGFFLSFCWVCTGFLGTGGIVDLQTVGCEVMSHGGDGRLVVLVVEAGIIQTSLIYRTILLSQLALSW